MIFSTTATHALRALAVLAADDGEEAVLGRNLATRIGVPSHYLAKVLAVLARGGILTASRGARGGYRLARPPEEIRLIEIVEPFEGKRVHPGCLLWPDQPCREDGACGAHAAWSGVKTAYTKFLETTRLAEIRGGGSAELKSLLARGKPRRPRRPAAGGRGSSSSRVRRRV
jgi:Rrf2 family protein